jgi:hypothetical protein
VTLIATPQQSLEAAAALARQLGVAAHVLSDEIEGESREVGKVHAALARAVARRGAPFARPCVILSGGETTVTLTRPDGRGGRATEFLLGCAVALQSVQSGYSRIPTSLDDQARMLGVTGFALARRVHWPLLRRSTVVAGLLVFVDVMKELPATLVLRPFNYDTLAVMAYQLARDERLGEAALPSLALVLVGLMPVVLLSRSLDEGDGAKGI